MIANHNDAQCYVLSAAITNDATIFKVVKPDALDDPYRGWAHAIEAVQKRYGRVTIEDYTVECQRRSLDPGYMRWFRGSMTDEYALVAFAESSGRERLMASLLRAKQRHDAGSPAAEIADELVESLADIPRIAPSERPAHSFSDILGMEGHFADWVIPDLLRHGTRCVMTGGEGWGKSTLIYQLALGAAYGIDPLGSGTGFDPKRVYVLDVENWHETQIKQQFLRLRHGYKQEGIPLAADPPIWVDHAKVINFLDPIERRDFVSRVDKYQPDLVVMGSGYKLVQPVGDWRLEAQTVMSTADEIRAKTGAAILIETHAGHGLAGDRNGWRPDGSSYWLRWPEFGLGLEPRQPKQAGRRLVQVHRWRGDRDTGAHWPYGWKSTATLPWAPCEREEFEMEAVPKAS
jgi:replicative DNA helicase